MCVCLLVCASILSFIGPLESLQKGSERRYSFTERYSDSACKVRARESKRKGDKETEKQRQTDRGRKRDREG